MTILAYLVMALSTAWIAVGLASVIRVTRSMRSRSRPSRAPQRPAVSILKPLCGADAELAKNIASFFEQDYPSFELVFGVQNADDPAISLVEELRRRHPAVPCKLVLHDGGGGINPKVDNLLGMLPYAQHDFLLVSDSNIRAPRHYLSEMVDVLESDPSVGLVTNLFAGAGENTLGAALENVQLNGFCAAGSALPTLLGDSLVVGKSMLFSRREFHELGGFERVANVLAEDFVIGKMFQHAGRRVRIAPTVLDNVTSSMKVGAFLARHLRWGMLRWRLRPLASLLEPLTSPLAVLPLLLVLIGPVAVTWALSLLMLRDVGGWIALRGWRRAWLPAVLAPARELLMLCVWFRAPFKRHVTWRGHRVRLGAGTLLFEVPSRSGRNVASLAF
jgi:ceramide glucosyltransferase